MNKFFLCLLILSLNCIISFAQNKLYIEEKSGKQNTFLIDSVSKFTFEGLSLVVNKSNGTIKRFNVYDIKLISSIDYRTYIIKPDALENSATLYPNPAINQIMLSFESKKIAKVRIDISDVSGNIYQEKLMFCNNGLNYMLFRIDDLSNGMYLCTLHFEDYAVTVKFIKN